MECQGKILFYNEQSGTGIIITPEKEKISFDINSWEDFENMPSLGLDVTLTCKDNQASAIYTLPKEEPQKNEPQEEELEEENLPPSLTTQEELDTEVTQKEYKTFRYKDQELSSTDSELSDLLSTTQESLNTVNKHISLTSNISKTMQSYFSNIYKQIKKREGYKKVDGRLEYILAKRFLWTTYNNLQEIDPHVITPRIKSIADDLLFMSTIEEDFHRKIRYPALTFEEIFLSNQTEYKKIKELTEKTFEKLSFLREKENSISAKKKALKKEFLRASSLEEKRALQKKEKVLNGTYADTVHVMASLKEEYKINTQRLQKFEQQYKDDFHKEFRKTAQKYENFLSEILNAQAFLLDSLLWKEAKISKPIQKHLQGLSIDIEFNTKEYLKYFLNTLDETKTNENTKELFTLYEHLKEIQKEYILIISSSSQDAMEYQYSMKELEKDYKIKSFVDELLALKWSMKNNVKLIIIDEYLSITTAKKFLDAYHTHILSKPKIIIIGEHQELHTKAFSVHKILSPAQSQHALLKTAKELLEK